MLILLIILILLLGGGGGYYGHSRWGYGGGAGIGLGTVLLILLIVYLLNGFSGLIAALGPPACLADPSPLWHHVSMSFLRQDLPHAWRGLARNPAFTLTAVVTLALGIGANTAIFSVLDTLLMRKLAGAPTRSVGVGPYGRHVAESLSAWEWEAYEAFRDHNQVFSGVLAFSPVTVSEMIREGRASRAQVDVCLRELLHGARRPPLVGLLSSPEGTPAIFLGFDYWRREFQSSPAALAKNALGRSSLYD